MKTLFLITLIAITSLCGAVLAKDLVTTDLMIATHVKQDTIDMDAMVSAMLKAGGNPEEVAAAMDKIMMDVQNKGKFIALPIGVRFTIDRIEDGASQISQINVPGSSPIWISNSSLRHACKLVDE
jgi:hypothetical protein